MCEKITQEEKNGPFGFAPKDLKSVSNAVDFIQNYLLNLFHRKKLKRC